MDINERDTMTVKTHPTNPHGVLVSCATCGKEIHIPKTDITKRGVDPTGITCSSRCMTAYRDRASRGGVYIVREHDLADSVEPFTVKADSPAEALAAYTSAWRSECGDTAVMPDVTVTLTASS